jgi:hypothetical protein
MTVVVVQQAAAPQVVVSLPAAPVAVTVGIQGPGGASNAVGPGFKLVGAEIRYDISSLTGV